METDPEPCPPATQHYVRQAQEAKAAFDAEVRAWERRLTPDDVRHENLFRTGQRKSGASKALNLVRPAVSLAVRLPNTC